MLVTINTDASHDSDLNIGAYAFWIVSNGFRVKQAGIFRHECFCATDAEAKCILNAVYALGTKEEYVSKVIINTDSMRCIDLFTGNGLQGKKPKHWKFLRKKFNRLKKNINGNFQVEFRHVKAHSGVQDARSKVNEWCDVTSRKFLRTERDRINS